MICTCGTFISFTFSASTWSERIHIRSGKLVNLPRVTSIRDWRQSIRARARGLVMESTLQDVFLAKEHTVRVGMNSTFQMFLNALNGVERILYDKGSV